jgi:hypothetical protein
MFEVQDNLRFSNKRIVAVSNHYKRLPDSHLQYLYYQYPTRKEKGFRNFFNVDSDKVTCAEARKYLIWLNNTFLKYRVLKLYVFPSCSLFNCFGSSEVERESAFQNVIRQSVERLLTEAKLSLRWIAAVDANRFEPFGVVVLSREIFDVETSEFYAVKNCFPKSFLERDEPKSENINFIEKTFAQAFFESAARNENFENRIDDLIEVSRKYKFELPLSYYAFRYLDDEGNLITEREKMRLNFNKRYEQFRLETTNPA